MAIGIDPRMPADDALDAQTREAFNLDSPVGGACFLCVEPLTHPAIYWMGSEQIWLHPRCAFGLAMGLLQDVERVDGLMALRESLGDRVGR